MWPFKKKVTEKEQTYTVELRLKELSPGCFRFSGMRAQEALILVKKIDTAVRTSPIAYISELPISFATSEFVAVSITSSHFFGVLNRTPLEEIMTTLLKATGGSVPEKMINAIKDAMPKPAETKT